MIYSLQQYYSCFKILLLFTWHVHGRLFPGHLLFANTSSKCRQRIIESCHLSSHFRCGSGQRTRFHAIFVHEARCLLLWCNWGPTEAIRPRPHLSGSMEPQDHTFTGGLRLWKCLLLWRWNWIKLIVLNAVYFFNVDCLQCDLALCIAAVHVAVGGESLDVCRSRTVFMWITAQLGQCQELLFACWFCWNPEEPAAPESFCVQLRVPQNSLISSRHVHLYSNTISPLVIVSFLQSFCSFLKKISSFSRCRLKIFERHLVVQRSTALVHIFIACFKMLTFCLWFLILQVYTVVAHWHVVFQCS